MRESKCSKNAYHSRYPPPCAPGNDLIKKIDSTISFEELSINAWPSLQTMFYDGWLLRFSGGYTRRANSVNPLYQGSRTVNEKISECERIYFGKRMDSVFKMTSVCFPQELDKILSERGYQCQGETSLQILDLEGTENSKLPRRTVALSEDASDEWLSSFCELSGINDSKKQIARQMLQNTIPRKRVASICNEQGKIVACGLAVLQRGYVGLFDIVTHTEYRRHGLGKQMTMALLDWAKLEHASRAYLQVVVGNEPALNLYHSLGFVERYRYWYRVKELA